MKIDPGNNGVALIVAPNGVVARLFADFAQFSKYVYVTDAFQLYGRVGAKIFVVDRHNVSNLHNLMEIARVRDCVCEFISSSVYENQATPRSK